MGKLSEIAMELDDQAGELGFESYEDAIERGGYEIDYENARLWKPLEEYDEAHEAWLKERDEVLQGLEEVKEDIINMTGNNKHLDVELIIDAIDFIEKGEC